MNFEEAVEKFVESPSQLTTGMPSLSKRWGVDLDTLNVVRNMQGFISVLMDVVKYDSKYYNVVSNQVGNVLLVDNIDNANKISKVINQRYKIVTLHIH